MRTFFIHISATLFFFNLTFQTSAQSTSTLVIYEDNKEGDSVAFLWVPSGFMPDANGIYMKTNYEEEEKEGTCILAGYSVLDATKDWVGVYWLADDSWKGPGVNVYKYLGVEESTAIKLTFRARGKEGGEKIQFKVGGVSDGNDSVKFPASTEWIDLTLEWQEYTIDLSKKNLANLVGGFCWVSSKVRNPNKDEIFFYLDDIKFEVIK